MKCLQTRAIWLANAISRTLLTDGIYAKFFMTKTLQIASLGAIVSSVARESVTSTVEKRVKRRRGRLFTYEDFDDLPVTAVAPALSRLAARGEIKRARKGIYYAPRRTVLGDVPPDPVVLGEAATRGRSYPAGLTAASILGLTTQVPSRVELAGEDKRPISPRGVAYRPRTGTNRRGLRRREAALLEVLRDIPGLSDLSPDDTIRRLMDVIADKAARGRIMRAAISEPPRVRAMVGALAEEADADDADLMRLRKTLNPTTKFDFGPLTALPTAKGWGARPR
jgi:hypothetical protein